MTGRKSHAIGMEPQPLRKRLLKPMAAFVLSASLISGVSRDTPRPSTYTVSHADSVPHSEDTVLMMTANLHGWQSPYEHETTQSALDTTLAETQPGIICSQEVVDGKETSALLKRYDGVFATTKRNFVGRRFGNMILSNSPIELEEVIPLPNYYSNEPRILMIARVLTNRGWLRVGNLHLSTNQMESREQIRFIEQHLERPVDVLCGDFNLTDPQKYTGPFGSSVSSISLAQYPQSNRHVKSFPSKMPIIGIDHIFTSCITDNDLTQATTRTRYIASDHDAVLAEIALDSCPSFAPPENQLALLQSD
jgi:endonuclease/exonuclease/phosphatase family metal-dependent hydrolase